MFQQAQQPAGRPRLAVLLALAVGGCGAADLRDAAQCRGKCDAPAARFSADLQRLNAHGAWGTPPLAAIDEAFSLRVRADGAGAGARFDQLVGTHLFHDADGRPLPVRVIPYGDDPQPPAPPPGAPHGRHAGQPVIAADGRPLALPELAIAEHFAPGELGIVIKHHRNEHRLLDIDQPNEHLFNELKLWDTHIGLVVGILREGERRAFTVNNPQDYQRGQFGDASYPMIFLRPTLPAYLAPQQQRAFRANMLAMLIGFNAVVPMADDFDGGDPLGGRSPQAIRELVAMMVRAVAGDAAALAFFRAKQNKMYCAELAHVALSAGLLVPLNEQTIVPLVRATLPPLRAGDIYAVGQSPSDRWREFVRQIELQNARARYLQLAPTARPVGAEPPASRLAQRNPNPYIQHVPLTLADAQLRPAASYCDASAPGLHPGRSCAAEAGRLALQPITAFDHVAEFVRTIMPRERLGESIAPYQAHVLERMRPKVYELMGLPDRWCGLLPAAWDLAGLKDWGTCVGSYLYAWARGIYGLYDELEATVGRSYPSYAAFLADLEPLLARARALKSPKDAQVPLFTPPSLFHVTARRTHAGQDPGGLLGFEYVGHGVHWSLVRPDDEAAARLMR